MTLRYTQALFSQILKYFCGAKKSPERFQSPGLKFKREIASLTFSLFVRGLKVYLRLNFSASSQIFLHFSISDDKFSTDGGKSPRRKRFLIINGFSTN
jgi:hypothetical protein